jgi:hypothetical protein
MLNKILNVQVSDTTEADSSNVVEFILPHPPPFDKFRVTSHRGAEIAEKESVVIHSKSHQSVVKQNPRCKQRGNN